MDQSPVPVLVPVSVDVVLEEDSDEACVFLLSPSPIPELASEVEDVSAGGLPVLRKSVAYQPVPFN